MPGRRDGDRRNCCRRWFESHTHLTQRRRLAPPAVVAAEVAVARARNIKIIKREKESERETPKEKFLLKREIIINISESKTVRERTLHFSRPGYNNYKVSRPWPECVIPACVGRVPKNERFSSVFRAISERARVCSPVFIKTWKTLSFTRLTRDFTIFFYELAR